MTSRTPLLCTLAPRTLRVASLCCFFLHIFPLCNISCFGFFSLEREARISCAAQLPHASPRLRLGLRNHYNNVALLYTHMAPAWSQRSVGAHGEAVPHPIDGTETN